MHIWYYVIEVIEMAEFCLDCWNKINETHEAKWRYVLSWDKDLCEECGQYKRVIVAERVWSRTLRALLETIKHTQNR